MSRLALFLCLAAALSAQQYTHLSGVIQDPSQYAVPGVSVSVVNEETGFRRSATTRNDGGYVVSSLQPGIYKITIRKEGFRTLVRFGVKLDVAQPARVDFTLSLGSMQETITVEGTAILANTENASVGTLVGRNYIERLPLNGRGLLSLIELAPGAVVTPATRGEAGQFTANGQRPNTHYFTVDGVSGNSGVSGGGASTHANGGSLPGMTALGSLHNLLSTEALDEFRVQTSSTNAEFGRLPGAQVSLSSRSGSNELHGSLFHYFRHERLDANDWFANRASIPRAPLRLNDFGASLGGPIRRNRTFFFAAYEGLRLRQPFAWRTPSPTLEARTQGPDWVQSLMNLFPVPTGPSVGPGLAEWTGRNNRPARLDAVNLRIDHALTNSISLFGRYNESPSTNQFGNTQINALEMESRSVTMGVNWRITPRLVADTRWSYSYADAASQWHPADPSLVPPCSMEPVLERFFFRSGLCDELVRVSIAGVGTIASGRESLRRQTQWNVIPSATANLGAHQLRFGMDFRRILPTRRDRNGTLGLLAESLEDLIAVRNLWIAVAPPQSSSSRIDEYSAFVQDTWRIHPRLTATFGLRWEFSPSPLFFLEETTADRSTAHQFESDDALWPARYRYFAPRVGAAYSFGQTNRTVIRGGWGTFYSSSLVVATDLVNGGPFSLSQFTSGRNGIFSTLLSYGFAPDLRLPRIHQWSGSIEHSFGSRDLVTASYVGATGRYLLRREIGMPGSTESLQLALSTNRASSDYHGLQLQYQRRIHQGLQAIAGYSWSHSIDDGSSDSALFWAGNGLKLSDDRASSDFDVRHTFNAAVTYEIPRTRRFLGGWSADSIFRARSGFPMTVLNAEQSMGITFANVFRPSLVPGQSIWRTDPAQPGGRILNRNAFSVSTSQQGNLGRNAITGFGMSQFDLSLRRDFQFAERRTLQFRVEAFNLLNRASFADPIPFLSSPLFGQSPSMLNLMLGTGSPGSGLTPILQTGGPRSLQLVLRFRF
jgi:hypothetical protein